MDFASPKKHYLSIRGEIDGAIKRVLESGTYVLGEEVAAFEREMAVFHGAKFAVGVNSGADALFLVLDTIGIKPGDEIIVPPFTMAASAEAVCRVGATPVFVDIDPATFNIDPEKIEQVITSRTKAIIPVHLFGQPADMAKIMAIARAHNLDVLEDACQSIGAMSGEKMVGSIGLAGALSFFPSKNFGGFGDGGMVVTNDEKLAEGIRLRRAHGAKSKYFHEVHGINSRLDPLQAAVLRAKLPHLNRWTQRRREIAGRYNTEFSTCQEIILPHVSQDVFHVYHQYTIRSKKRDALRDHLERNGIPTMQYYPHPLHTLPIFEQGKYKKEDMPEAVRACEEVLSLPVDPFLTDSEQGVVISGIKSFLG